MKRADSLSVGKFSYSGSKRENKRERGTIYKYTVLKAKSLREYRFH